MRAIRGHFDFCSTAQAFDVVGSVDLTMDEHMIEERFDGVVATFRVSRAQVLYDFFS